MTSTEDAAPKYYDAVKGRRTRAPKADQNSSPAGLSQAPKKARCPYSEETAETICDLLIEGQSMRQICSRPSFPNRSTVLRWMDANPEFAARCARAREMQADYMDDLILETANACTPETAHADKVKISAYQWRAAKLAPKKYSERHVSELVGKNGGPIETRELSPVERAQRIAFVLRQGLEAMQDRNAGETRHEHPETKSHQP